MSKAPSLEQVDTHLWLIDLPQPQTGFRRFISTWLYRDQDVCFLVDPGPASSVTGLVSLLAAQGVTALDALLLTHIHLDHAGGAGTLAQQLPVQEIFCHPKATRHLIDPTRLWEGSRKVLGNLAEMYGPLVPLPQNALRPLTTPTTLRGRPLWLAPTPGHAPHHLAFVWQGNLFAGEAAGVIQHLDHRLYMRPATPPRFRRETFLTSLQTLQTYAARHRLKRLCYGHFGWRTDVAQALADAKQQLHTWLNTIGAYKTQPDDFLFHRLMEIDPFFALFSQLPHDIQQREQHFRHNSVRGIRTETEITSTST